MKYKGYTGKILNVNLTERKIESIQDVMFALFANPNLLGK